MSKPRHGFSRTRHDKTSRLVGSCDHDHRQAKRARRLDLGVGRRAAGIFGHHHIDLLVLQQTKLGGAIERAAPAQQHQVGRQAHLLGRLDQAREVAMLRRGGEEVQLLSAKAQEDAPRRSCQGLHGCSGRWHALPDVPRQSHPGRPNDGNERHAAASASGHGVGRDLRRVRMRGVDHRADCVLGEVADVVTTGQRVVPKKALALGYTFRYPQIDAALAEICK